MRSPLPFLWLLRSPEFWLSAVLTALVGSFVLLLLGREPGQLEQFVLGLLAGSLTTFAFLRRSSD